MSQESCENKRKSFEVQKSNSEIREISGTRNFPPHVHVNVQEKATQNETILEEASQDGAITGRI